MAETRIPMQARRTMINTFMQKYIEGKVASRPRESVVITMALSAQPTVESSLAYTTLKEVAGIIYDNLYSGVCLSFDYTASV